MKRDIAKELLASLQEVLEHAQGKRTLKTTLVTRAPRAMAARDVRQVRETLHASQAIFASYLNVSPKLVQAWEGNRRTPEGPALVLLRLIERDPSLVDTIYQYPATPSPKKPARSAPKMRLVKRAK